MHEDHACLPSQPSGAFASFSIPGPLAARAKSSWHLVDVPTHAFVPAVIICRWVSDMSSPCHPQGLKPFSHLLTAGHHLTSETEVALSPLHARPVR